jgi:hypothetical protein
VEDVLRKTSAQHCASEREGSEREGSEREGSEREGSEREGSEREGSEREGRTCSRDDPLAGLQWHWIFVAMWCSKEGIPKQAENGKKNHIPEEITWK